jgi:hypothetical protein
VFNDDVPSAKVIRRRSDWNVACELATRRFHHGRRDARRWQRKGNEDIGSWVQRREEEREQGRRFGNRSEEGNAGQLEPSAVGLALRVRAGLEGKGLAGRSSGCDDYLRSLPGMCASSLSFSTQ